METLTLLKRIIDKGGLMAHCAKKYVLDEKKAEAFLKECSEQCHNLETKKLWGDDLVSDLLLFSNKIK